LNHVSLEHFFKEWSDLLFFEVNGSFNSFVKEPRTNWSFQFKKKENCSWSQLSELLSVAVFAKSKLLMVALFEKRQRAITLNHSFCKDKKCSWTRQPGVWIPWPPLLKKQKIPGWRNMASKNTLGTKSKNKKSQSLMVVLFAKKEREIALDHSFCKEPKSELLLV